MRQRSLILRAMLFLASLVPSACDNVAVDAETASAVKRQRDTLVPPPDTVVIARDTVVLARDTIFITQRDTLRVTVFDTVRIDTRPPGWEGRIFLLNPALSAEIAPDTAGSSLRIHLERGVPKRIDLLLLARSPERPKPPPFRTPSWIHLSVVDCPVDSARARALTIDPTRTPFGNGMGVLFRPEESEPARWYATSGLSTGSFRVVDLAPSQRSIRCVATGTYFSTGSATPALKIDSLWVVVKY